MKYKLIKLTKENDLNRELRKQKRERGEISILFVSNWDKYCTELVEKLEILKIFLQLLNQNKKLV